METVDSMILWLKHGFPSMEEPVYGNAGPDPPSQESYSDPPHEESYIDPPHWSD